MGHTGYLRYLCGIFKKMRFKDIGRMQIVRLPMEIPLWWVVRSHFSVKRNNRVVFNETLMNDDGIRAFGLLFYAWPKINNNL